MQSTPNYKTMSATEANSGLTLVLIGFQGSGKSATGNTILKRKCFRYGMGTIGTTQQVSIEECFFHGKTVAVVDTPPLSSMETLTDIIKDLSTHQLTTAVYAIVIAVGRFTLPEKNLIDGMLSNCQSFMQDRTLLIFTRKKELNGFDGAEDKLQAWFDTTPAIRSWIRKYKLPFFAIENSSEEYDKMDEIMATAENLNQHAKQRNVSALKPLHLNSVFIFLGDVYRVYIITCSTKTNIIHNLCDQLYKTYSNTTRAYFIFAKL